jgi:hypothetical protein
MIMSQEVAASGGVSEGHCYSSPARVLIRSFRMSRDNWKRKYQELKRVLKRCQVQVHDVRTSRDAWRKRAESAEQKLIEFGSPATSLVTVESEKK